MKTAALKYSVRFVSTYRWVASFIGILASFWVIVFLANGQTVVGTLLIGLVAFSIVSVLLVSRNHLSAAMMITQLVYMAYVLVLCLLYDIPSPELPRTTHVFCLVLAMLGYLNLKRERSQLQVALIGLNLVAFVVFASTNIVPPWADPTPEHLRRLAGWINMSAVALLFVGFMRVLRLDFERSGRQVQGLREALWQRQFELFYLPQVDTNGTILGAEALIRWRHPTRGYVPPGEFIPLAEETGLMSQIGRWVMEEACQSLMQWARTPHLRQLTLSVNVSASQFLDADFETGLVEMLGRYGIDPTRLKLEITESVMVHNMAAVASKMQALRALGIGLALDDFGTGYSSLASLRGLPLTQLKIDRSFVLDITVNERSATLARGIVQLGRDLNLTVLAEGVETAEQFAFLKACGCDEFQGYHFGRPVPLPEFISRASALSASPA